MEDVMVRDEQTPDVKYQVAKVTFDSFPEYKAKCLLIAEHIADETARAKKAETANTKSITDEVTRAKAAEAANSKAVAAETTRAKAAEAANAKAVTDEATRAKNAEAANTKLTNDLKAGITSGSVKAAKAGTADSASALGRLSTFWTMIPDNGGRRKYLLMFDISEWVPKTSNSGTYGFDGIFFSRRSGG